eukprot:scaffold707_cov399-Prasinococcus_capsulatus_cf.AAC.32
MQIVLLRPSGYGVCRAHSDFGRQKNAVSAATGEMEMHDRLHVLRSAWDCLKLEPGCYCSCK